MVYSKAQYSTVQYSTVQYLAGGCPLQQPDGVVGGVDVVQGGVGLPPVSHDSLHHVHTGHRCNHAQRTLEKINNNICL